MLQLFTAHFQTFLHPELEAIYQPDFGRCASHLTRQWFKVKATKISTKITWALFYIFSSCICEKPRLVHCELQASWWPFKKEAVLCGAVSVSTLPQHSSVCTRTDGQAWSAKHSCSMSGICCLMSSSIKPSGRDESSKPVHQPRLLYSNSH